jgi:uncharacterized membrane protein
MIGAKGFRTSTKIAVGAIFAALVAIVTASFPIIIPPGYFNLGEVIIYVAALLFGPLVGTFAGAGAAIADILLGFAIFAPGTLVIKGSEGFIVGFLNHKLKNRINPTVSAIISILAGGFVMIIGYFIYEVAIIQTYTVEAATAEALFVNTPQMLIGLVVAVPVMHAILRFFPQLKTSPLATEK